MSTTALVLVVLVPSRGVHPVGSEAEIFITVFLRKNWNEHCWQYS